MQTAPTLPVQGKADPVLEKGKSGGNLEETEQKSVQQPASTIEVPVSFIQQAVSTVPPVENLKAN